MKNKDQNLKLTDYTKYLDNPVVNKVYNAKIEHEKMDYDKLLNVKMDKDQLKKLLQPLLDQCKANNISANDIFITEEESFKGIKGSSFYVNLYIPDLTLENYLDIRSKVFNIFQNKIHKNIKSHVFTLCVTNKLENNLQI